MSGVAVWGASVMACRTRMVMRILLGSLSEVLIRGAVA
jgi:hypothetical protein